MVGIRIRFNRTRKLLPPSVGCVLVSEPLEREDFFFRSVILLLGLDSDGSLGLILNRPLGLKLNEFFNTPVFGDYSVFQGGPVDEDCLFYIHNVPGVVGASSAGENLYVGGDLSELSKSIEGVQSDFFIKFFLGYAGWSSGQLVSELKDESWGVVNPIAGIITAEGEQSWFDSLSALDDDYYRLWQNFPVDPSFN